MSEEAEMQANHSDENYQEAVAPTQADSFESQLEQPREEERVPLSALQSERKQRQQREEELQLMKDHLALMQSRQSQPREEPRDVLEQLPDDDIPTWGDVKRVFSEREKTYQARISELQMAQKYPDYADVINKYLPEVIKQNPGLRDTLSSTQDYELAYYLAKNSDNYRTANKTQKINKDAERIIENSNKAGSLSSTGTMSPINAAKRYRDMPDKDFKALVNKNLGYMN